MKSIKQYINEKLVLNKSTNSTSKDILNVEIKSLEHLKEVLTNYYEVITTYEIKPSRILTKPIKWHNPKHCSLRTFANIGEIEVGDHFKIEFLYKKRVVYRVCAAEYKDTFIIQQTFCIRSSSNPDEIIGLTNKYAYSPENPLAPGRNLLEWLNDLKSIKLSNGKLPFANEEFLRLLELNKDE